MSGGIAIADLMNTGDTKILLKDNIVKNNRYGYNQQGYNLSSVIVGNQFIDNNNETNPMNGGSGISIFGMNENNKAVLRNNVITGNLGASLPSTLPTSTSAQKTTGVTTKSTTTATVAWCMTFTTTPLTTSWP